VAKRAGSARRRAYLHTSATCLASLVDERLAASKAAQTSSRGRRANGDTRGGRGGVKVAIVRRRERGEATERGRTREYCAGIL
jgi:hypothetical protein